MLNALSTKQKQPYHREIIQAVGRIAKLERRVYESFVHCLYLWENIFVVNYSVPTKNIYFFLFHLNLHQELKAIV